MQLYVSDPTLTYSLRFELWIVEHTGNGVNHAGENVLARHSHHFWCGPKYKDGIFLMSAIEPSIAYEPEHQKINFFRKEEKIPKHFKIFTIRARLAKQFYFRHRQFPKFPRLPLSFPPHSSVLSLSRHREN